ncbi:unnamed protein product [Prunus brigantina]
MGVDDFFNPHGDADFDPEFDSESGSYFDDLYYDDNPDLDPYYHDDDPDPDSDDNPKPESVYDLDPDADFDSDPDSGSDPNPNSYKTCIICIFRCTNYDFPTNNPDTWMRLSILW